MRGGSSSVQRDRIGRRAVRGQVAFAQVGWTHEEVCVPPGDPGSWDSGRHRWETSCSTARVPHVPRRRAGSWLDYPWSVGHWTSSDVGRGPGKTHNPVLEPGAGSWDSFSIYNIAVLYDGAEFHMWYGAAEVYRGPV